MLNPIQKFKVAIFAHEKASDSLLFFKVECQIKAVVASYL